MRSRRSQAGVRPCSKCAIRRALLFTIVVIALWLSPAPAGAQGTSGTILGTVTDSSGASGAGTTVTVTNVDTGTSRSVIADSTGNYQVPLLLPGRYKLPAKDLDFGKRSSPALCCR